MLEAVAVQALLDDPLLRPAAGCEGWLAPSLAAEERLARRVSSGSGWSVPTHGSLSPDRRRLEASQHPLTVPIRRSHMLSLSKGHVARLVSLMATLALRAGERRVRAGPGARSHPRSPGPDRDDAFERGGLEHRRAAGYGGRHARDDVRDGAGADRAARPAHGRHATPAAGAAPAAAARNPAREDAEEAAAHRHDVHGQARAHVRQLPQGRSSSSAASRVTVTAGAPGRRVPTRAPPR